MEIPLDGPLSFLIPTNTNSLQLTKSVLMSIPEFCQVFEGNYEKLFSTKTGPEFLLTIIPIMWRFYRNPTISVDTKFNVFQKIRFDLVMNSLKEMTSLEQFIMRIGTCVSVGEKIPSPLTRDVFNTFLDWVKTTDTESSLNIDQLTDPFFFPQKFNVRLKLIQLLPTASQKALEEILTKLAINLNVRVWDIEIDVNTLDIEQVKEFVSIIENHRL
ncbi:hypothetical protein EIN_085710 [Entamoeba invadens IP1]|uniref:hypothetical protein n=1 Tax=Entamoeba invadens IP1 TaxID=370355 RepID=UPI0002C3D6FE|nr:hypothetical protein EIN_085710 [Entamoeba invadens IP1]ELP85329.1 hypothetical protein EIN_085710 [Entamoeba invadens IP1]|eukprot:XP_004184675.1 hypothetical protein EIN_085710 [Entamoeba invadens IP1]